ncbi:MAG: type I 3-dehydroquinate dehydratase [Candidatus Bathyarchaeota archaeon]|nr:type I 3-dehydroquinate dehydratase [Candidatus Bathyarchaeota archaeon]
MTARICVSILPKNNLEALTLIKQAENANADFIEVRLDCLETSRNLKELTNITKTPLIATNKLEREHGFFSGTEAERQQTLLESAKNGFQYVDVDLSSSLHQETLLKLKETGVKTIVSFHKFDGPLTNSEMEEVLQQQLALDADVCKIVTTASTVEDNLAILQFIAKNKKQARLVCFCMGENGKLSRLFSPLFGAFFTFAALDTGSETAKGQMSIGEMKASYGMLGV